MDSRRNPTSPSGSEYATAPPVPTNVTGLTGEFTDPLWRAPVRLNPVEADLLRTRPLRRLHFVTHGGSSTLTTLQTYSRLEHSLGVLSLAAHFAPDDADLRVAALLHDIGHLPLSHTFEGLAGLDHHEIGLRLVRSDPIRSVLRDHGIEAGTIVDRLRGRHPSPLTGHPGLLNLDHLDSYVRSGRSAGRLDTDPAVLLSRLDLRDHTVSADAGTAAALVALIRAEARLHTSWDNVGPTSVVQRLVRRLLDHTPLTPEVLARMTDAELWSALDSCPATRAESGRVQYEPHRLKVGPQGETGEHPGWPFSLRKIYSSAPLVDGEKLEHAAPELAAELSALRALPLDFRVSWD
ncbi:HD domain-containing protein [Streptomyces alboflavus]|uniref:HD domain-containing protein n=1 Tax=Streptomyces alboflavus TaxID=67267 RepID=UPI0036CD60EF